MAGRQVVCGLAIGAQVHWPPPLDHLHNGGMKVLQTVVPVQPPAWLWCWLGFGSLALALCGLSCRLNLGALAALAALGGRGVLGPGSEAAAGVADWLLRGACGGLRGATTGHHIMPRTGWSRCWLQAGRTKRWCTCPAGGFQPAGLGALRLFSCLSQGCWQFTAELA
ncbi:hypothetical protein HaLaN_20135 [Haematococcus lacustris]|uniref:Uncharacterized protein n=1 Tax=Haematococcus lacustris TaxID=44745 RepID=A0A699ZN96_HAELA|nr:hypothetical protein HaLaN_20135 [Haematococcus lacustris]